MLIRADRHVALQPAIAAWLDGVRLPRRVRLVVDIDPQSFL
jgi:primosomal protein N' (replication factor Y)